jgi:hypothetical protein
MPVGLAPLQPCGIQPAEIADCALVRSLTATHLSRDHSNLSSCMAPTTVHTYIQMMMFASDGYTGSEDVQRAKTACLPSSTTFWPRATAHLIANI